MHTQKQVAPVPGLPERAQIGSKLIRDVRIPEAEKNGTEQEVKCLKLAAALLEVISTLNEQGDDLERYVRQFERKFDMPSSTERITEKEEIADLWKKAHRLLEVALQLKDARQRYGV